MTLFSRYYQNRILIGVSMDEIKTLIENESNKKKIAEAIFHRYYDRYLKIFFYQSSQKYEYTKVIGSSQTKISASDFDEEFKHGFGVMANCCLLIETLGSFFDGTNKSKKEGSDIYKLVFRKAKEYRNPLECFEKEPIYGNIRCGLLHQGETYGKFKILRAGELYDKTNKSINAKLFCDNMKSFLLSYKNELESSKWDSDIWDKCRVKIRHIVDNS